MLSPIKIGYVPEHFSSPLLLLAQKDKSIELIACPSGTGQITSRLKSGEIDVAIALTEALIAGIAKRVAQYKIVGTYVTSPLNWGVIVGKDATFTSLADLRGKPIGISRIGSGSQVMASYMGLKEGWVDHDGNVEPIEFKVLDTFKALRDATNDGTTACFMWEKFTTKPFTATADGTGTGECQFLDFVPTPWESWMVVAAPHVEPAFLTAFLARLTGEVHAFNSPEGRGGSSPEFVEGQFGYPRGDVEAWFEQVDYPKAGLEEVRRATMEKTLSTLEAAGVLPKQDWNLDDFVDTRVAKLV